MTKHKRPWYRRLQRKPHTEAAILLTAAAVGTSVVGGTAALPDTAIGDPIRDTNAPTMLPIMPGSVFPEPKVYVASEADRQDPVLPPAARWYKTVYEAVVLPFKTVRRPDSSLLRGEKKVARKGKDGLVVKEYRHWYHGSTPTGKVELVDKERTAPIPKVVRVGNRWSKRVVEKHRLPYTTRTVYNADVPSGTSKVRREGRDGYERVAYILTYAGDRLLARDRIEVVERVAPVERIVVVGTKRVGVDIRLYRPVPGHITSAYGMRWHPVLGGYRFHTGIDLNGYKGEPIRAAEAGRVTFTGYENGWGNRIWIDHGNWNDRLLRTNYNHLSGYAVSPGQYVQRGQIIGYVGSTGYSTGPHLHFEVWRGNSHVNPINYL
jgi:hypothetical protein